MAHQEPPAADAADTPPPPDVAAGPPHTYRELYADAVNNPTPDHIAGYLAGIDSLEKVIYLRLPSCGINLSRLVTANLWPFFAW